MFLRPIPAAHDLSRGPDALKYREDGPRARPAGVAARRRGNPRRGIEIVKRLVLGSRVGGAGVPVTRLHGAEAAAED